MPACWIYKSNLTECNLRSVLSLWLLFLVRNVIVQEVQKLRPSEACSPLPAVDWTSIIPGVSADAEGVISRGEQRTCKSNCFNPLKHLSSFSRGKLGVQQRSSEPWSWLERKTKPVAEELYDAPWSANCAVGVWMAGLSNWQIFVLNVRDRNKLGQSFSLSAVIHTIVLCLYLSFPSTYTEATLK